MNPDMHNPGRDIVAKSQNKESKEPNEPCTRNAAPTQNTAKLVELPNFHESSPNSKKSLKATQILCS
jgi:hypothetical protein